ncbi:MAG TPA: hypothetical protein VGY53_12415 [Isosphaeraceae bacterium]|nr:hypothetical protein [Isosphaeraceae bacterium]
MTHRRRIPLEEILSAALPAIAWGTPTHGVWLTSAGQADWELEPEGGGYWLVLSGATKAAQTLADLFQVSRDWAWPLKVACREPGAAVSWCAEIRLLGAQGEVAGLERLVCLLERRLSRGDVPGAAAAVNEPIDATHVTADEDLLLRALGDSLKRTSQGFRLPVENGPALAITSHEGGWVFRTALVRHSAPVPAPVLASLYDFLAVTNRRVRGCRAIGARAETDTLAELETRVAANGLTESAIQSAAAFFTHVARLVAPACEVLVGQPRIGAFYRDVLALAQAV